LHEETVAEKLGYRPNPLISALMAQLRTTKLAPYIGTLAFINSDVAQEADSMPCSSRIKAAQNRIRNARNQMSKDISFEYL